MVEAAEISVVRTGATALLRSRVAGLNAGEVVSGGRVLGVVEPTGAGAILVRARGGLTVRALRSGTRVSHTVAGRQIGYSQFRNGRVEHFVIENGLERRLGFDLVRGNRVLQHDDFGRLIAETTIDGLNPAGPTLAAAMATFLAASGDNRTAVTDLQLALAEAGHDPGPINGTFGPATARALASARSALTKEQLEKAIAQQTRVVLNEIRSLRSSRNVPRQP
jgi:hypothetical protein